MAWSPATAPHVLAGGRSTHGFSAVMASSPLRRWSTQALTTGRGNLVFIAKYQDAATGMIWHELSQSADPADWATRYPNRFVHVDITFQYLTVVERYVSASGDTAFLQQHWPGIEAAYRYCRS